MDGPIGFILRLYLIQLFARTVLYVGVTSNLQSRLLDHKQETGSVFTSAYKCHYLMYYEDYTNIRNAIAREKKLKKWKREWKIALIRKENPEMKDLAEGLCE